MESNRPAKKAKKPLRKSKPKKPQKKPMLFIPGPTWFSGPLFNILPPHALPNQLLHISLTCMPCSVTAIATLLTTPFKPYFDSQSALLKGHCLDGSIENPFTEAFYEAKQQAVKTCQALRWIFRRFLHRWRVSRLSKPVTEDIVTGMVPKRPVLLVDWKARTATPFEATTLMRDITERLQLHDGFFEDPQLPRNPLTNLPFTLAQQIGVWNSLSSSGIVCSAVFTEFRRVRWDLQRFLNEYAVPLQLRAFQMTMRDISHEDTRERLLDFIEYAYDQEAIDCSVISYKYALQRFQDHPLLSKWVDLCTEYYSAAILWNRLPQRCSQIQSAVLDKTIALLDRQKELVHLRNADLKIQRDQIRADRRALRVMIVPLSFTTLG